MKPTIVAELRPTRIRVSSAGAALLTVVIAAAALGCASKPERVAVQVAAALPFIENDFSQAVARASQANLPLFVEVWAPW